MSGATHSGRVSGTLFAAVIAALALVSARPSQAAALDAGPCAIEVPVTPICTEIVTPVYCRDEEGNVWQCGTYTEYLYYDENNQG